MDNFFKSCPAMMEDGGRDLGNYKTPTRREEYIKYINRIERDDEYRLFLQQNAKEFMDNEWNYYKRTQSCHVSDCVHSFPTRQNPMDLALEKRLYDSRNSSNPELAKLRVCKKYPDYRLN